MQGHLGQDRIPGLLDPQQQPFPDRVRLDHVTLPEAPLCACRAHDPDARDPEARDRREQPAEDRRSR